MPVRGYPTSGTQLGVYPDGGTRTGTYPSGSSSIDLSQSFGVEATPMTLGVIDIAQSFNVEASGSTGADIADLPNVVAVFDSTSTVVTSSASITFGTDQTNAAWTKTNCSAAATGTGTQTRITVTSASPVVSQTITNAQFVSTLMVPCVITAWFSYENIQYVVLMARASAVVNLQHFDIQNGAVGASTTGMSSPSISPETRSGVAGYRVSVTVTGCAAALTARFGLSTTDTSITSPANATTIIVDDFTVSQIRVESVEDRKSGSLLSQATVNLQPGYEVGPLGEPCRVYYGAQYLLDTEATHYGAVDGADAEYTLHYVADVTTPDALGTIVGAGNSGVANNQARLWGTSATGAGRYRSQVHDDAAASSIVDSTVDIAADAFVGEWTTGTAGTTISHSKNGAAANPNATAQNVGTVTLNRMAEGARPDSTPDSLFIGRVYAWVLTEGAPNAPQNTTVRQDLYSQYGLSGS